MPKSGLLAIALDWPRYMNNNTSNKDTFLLNNKITQESCSSKKSLHVASHVIYSINHVC